MGGFVPNWAPECGSSSVEPDGSISMGGFVPNWGHRPINDPRDQEFANEWTTRSESYYRRSRGEIIKKGVHLRQSSMKITCSLKDAPE